MFAPLSLLLLLVGAGLGLILGARQMNSVVTADGSSVELRRHATRSAQWSTAGVVVVGVVAALMISRWDTLGRGLLLAAPLLALTGVGVATAAIALIDIVRRTRLGDTDPGHVDDVGICPTTADDELRRRSVRTVIAASGVAVAIPLTGVATFGVIALAGTDCLPLAGRVVQYAWGAVIPLTTILLGWSAMTLVVNSVSVAAWRRPVR